MAGERNHASHHLVGGLGHLDRAEGRQDDQAAESRQQEVPGSWRRPRHLRIRYLSSPLFIFGSTGSTVLYIHHHRRIVRGPAVSEFSVSKAIITGGAQGIGFSIAHRLSAEGLTVSVLDINESGAKDAAEKITADTGNPAFGFACNVAKRPEVHSVFEQAAEAMGGLDTYIGNAGITRDKMFHKLTDEDWDAVISVNLTGVFAGIQASAPYLRKEGPGRVVLISSIVAKSGNLGQMNYIAAKAGVVGLVRSGATELARFGTTVNGIRPGFIETPMTAA